MTTMQQHLTMAAQSQAAQHDDPPATTVCPSSPEGAMPLQSATLSHKKIPLSEIEALAAAQGRWRHGQATTADVELINRSSQKVATAAHCLNVGRGLASPDTEMVVPGGAIGAGQYEPGQQRVAAYEGAASGGGAGSSSLSLADIEGNAQKLPDWKDLDLRPGNVWQMNSEPKLESYEGIPAEVINEAGIRGDDVPHVVLEKLEAQMKGKWAMVRFGRPVVMGIDIGRNGDETCRVTRVGDKIVAIERMPAPPEEMVNVRGERRPVDEYCVATPVPCTIPTVQEALAMREMVEKAAEAMRGRGAAMPERSFLSLPRQHDSPLSARVVPSSEAPDPKVGW